jgi:CBS domain-containing protein
MTARDVMTTDIVTVPASATAREAAELMVEHGHAALPVVDDEGSFVAMLTDEDLLRLTLPKYLDSIEDLSFLPRDYEPLEHPPSQIRNLRVLDVVTSGATHVAQPEDHVAEVARIICEEHVRRVAVVEDGKLVGIVSRADLVERIVLPTLREE